MVFGRGSRTAEIRRVRLNGQVANVHFHVLVYKAPYKISGIQFMTSGMQHNDLPVHLDRL